MRKMIGAAVVALGIATTASSAATQDFYAGEQIRVIVGTGAGGGYDTCARRVARHLGEPPGSEAGGAKKTSFKKRNAF